MATQHLVRKSACKPELGDISKILLLDVEVIANL